MYLRVSTPEQAERHSLGGQEDEGRGYCRRLGYRVTRIFRDAGKSARGTDRETIYLLLWLARRRAFDVLVVWDLDRLARNAWFAGFVAAELAEYGVRIESVTMGPMVEGPEATLLRNVKHAFDQYRSDHQAVGISMGKKRAAREGMWPTGAPYGYERAQDGRLAIFPEEAERVREAYRLCIAGTNSRDLGRLLGLSWSHASTLLRRTTYKGDAVFAGIAVPCPAIVDADTWARAQAALRARFRVGTGAVAFSRREPWAQPPRVGDRAATLPRKHAAAVPEVHEPRPNGKAPRRSQAPGPA